MIPWLWLIPAVVTGALFGILLLALVTANRDKD